MQDKRKELKGIFYILCATAIWGYAFVAQKSGTEFLGAFAFTGFRSLLGSAALVPLVLFFDKKKTPEQKASEVSGKTLVLWALAGSLFVSAFNCFQQFGLVTSDAGKGAFITALYILFVPLFGVFFKQKIPFKIWGCVFIAMMGFYIMSLTSGISAINTGDLLILAGSVFIAIHIYLLDFVANKVDVVKFNCLQFLFSGILCSLIALLIEHPTWQNVVDCAWPMIYAGVCSSAFGYLFQTMGQKYLSPAKTSLVLSSESIFALLCGMIFLHERLMIKDVIGCSLIFAAILLSQIELKKKNKETL